MLVYVIFGKQRPDDDNIIHKKGKWLLSSKVYSTNTLKNKKK